jgi:manganese/zinc/iron transport system permease protein
VIAAFIWDWSIDGWIIAIGILSGVSASLLGNFLVLRRMSLLGDAISHAVLPGLVVAFLINQTRDSWTMLLGAMVVGVFTAWLTEWIHRLGKIDDGASMGVVFTTLFALGLLLIRWQANTVHLDADCVFYGAIENAPNDTQTLLGLDIPRTVIVLAIVLILNLAFVLAFYKELKLLCFDPLLATTSGHATPWLHYALMTLVAVTCVACFESVGNILVVAMLIVPASTGLLLSERLSRVIWLSALSAIAAAVLGHVGAVYIPRWFGFRSTSTAGMMAAASGVIFFVVSLFSPKRGVLVTWFRMRRLAWRILSEDVVAALYRMEERGQPRVAWSELADVLFTQAWAVRLACWRQMQRGWLQQVDQQVFLTEAGRSKARDLVRTHRLWESYLVDQAGSAIDRIHAQAERLEHFTNETLRRQLQVDQKTTNVDPHGREIPE